MVNLFSLENKVAIVTGARSGLGRAMAVGLASAGANIVGVGRNDMPVTKNEVEVRGSSFLELQEDLHHLDAVDRIIAAAVAEFGKIDILVNNAGIIRRADAIAFTQQDWDETMDVNLKTVFFLSQAVAKQYLKQGTGGKIINIASMLSFQGGIRVASYTASKSGILGITRLMANEWAGFNINTNAIAPGYMDTDNTAAIRADAERNRAILERIPAGRWGKPEDIQGAVIFLAGPASDYLNGSVVVVDGGWLAR